MCWLANYCAQYTYITHRYCIVVDLELTIKDRELRKYADKIVNFWQRVGLELGLEDSTLTVIEANNPDRKEKAALDMLRKRKQVKINPIRRELQQAIENCQVQGIARM